MNASTRREIEEITERMEILKAGLEEIRIAEEEKYDNMPKQFQNCPNGEKMQEWIDAIDNATSSIEEAADSLRSVE